MKATPHTGFITTAEEPLIFERSREGRVGYSLPELDVDTASLENWLPKDYVRDEVKGFPELSENEVVRHYTRLSQKNYAIDLGLYPLGSCTMKYNPKINEEVSRSEELARSHPYWPESFLQTPLAVQYQLEELLKFSTGFQSFSLQPSAGAHGEYTGLKMIKAYHELRGNKQKTKVLIPESAHGTNPATCSMVGYDIVSIPTNPKGVVELADVEPLIDDTIAGIMITNPNTLGLFETHIKEIADKIHEVDGLFYMDGANFNAMLGVVLPAKLGVDVMHINLHKTFSTPHGGGGPGAGAVGVSERLKDFLPTPVIKKDGKNFTLDYSVPNSIGRVGGYYGNFAIHIRALAYMLSLGQTKDGEDTYLRKIAEAAVLNANYIRKKLEPHFSVPFNSTCMHEVLLSDDTQSEYGIKTSDIAKRMMDYGYHPMTVYFPLVVSGAMLIEPTESESKESIDEFCEAMIAIAKECKEDPELVRSAPHNTFRRRVDELRAQKQPQLRWQ